MPQPQPQPQRSARLEVLDYLRFAAAVIVLFAHWTFSGIRNGKIASLETYSPIAHVTQYGYLGVEIFFMISGYVIFASTRHNSARRFAVRRALRLYPTFWVAMLTTAVVTALWGQASGLRVTVKNVIANLTMVPELIGAAPVDGVYWTLVYELEFYLLVFLLLLAKLGSALGRVIAIWSVLLLGVAVFAPGLDGYAYLSGYFALFCFGGLLAEVHGNGPRWWSVGGLVCASVATIMKVHQVASRQSTFALESFQVWVAVATFVLAGLCIASLGVRQVATVRLPGSAKAGALTYPLYLLHAHIGFIAITQFGTEANRGWIMPVLFVGMIGASWVLHRVVEVRMKPIWLSLFILTVDRPVSFLESRCQQVFSRISWQRVSG